MLVVVTPARVVVLLFHAPTSSLSTECPLVARGVGVPIAAPSERRVVHSLQRQRRRREQVPQRLCERHAEEGGRVVAAAAQQQTEKGESARQRQARRR